MSNDALSNLLHEERRFPPDEQFSSQANVSASAYTEAAQDRLAFWEPAAQRLDWAEPWTEVLDWTDPPFAKWFVGGTLNAAVNCVDRHVAAGRGDQVAYPLGGRAGRHPHDHLRRPAARGLPGRERAARARGAARATGSRSTCR